MVGPHAQDAQSAAMSAPGEEQGARETAMTEATRARVALPFHEMGRGCTYRDGRV